VQRKEAALLASLDEGREVQAGQRALAEVGRNGPDRIIHHSVPVLAGALEDDRHRSGSSGNKPLHACCLTELCAIDIRRKQAHFDLGSLWLAVETKAALDISPECRGIRNVKDRQSVLYLGGGRDIAQ